MNQNSSEQYPAEKLSFGKLLLHYLYDRRMATGMFLLCTLVFFSACLLSRVNDLSDLLYAFSLCAFLFLCSGIYGFQKYVRQYNMLFESCRNTENMTELLPAPHDLAGEQYRKIIETLLEDRRRLLLDSSRKEMERSDYYTMWAHQIKTPIAAMKLLLQNREESGEAMDPGNEENSGNGNPVTNPDFALSRELFKIEQYVEMVLYYLRLDSISSDFLIRQYDLHDIVIQAVRKHSILFIRSGLSLELEDFHSVVVTDEKWLQFAIEQILSNALKYTARGRIFIRAEETPEKKLLVIEDTGIGIRPEDLPRIFERGFTGRNGRMDKKSTGIGLYLSRQILDKLSHTIEVTSEVGRGTRIRLGFSQSGPEEGGRYGSPS